MKKIHLLLIIGFLLNYIICFGQTKSQRLVLAEEFTQASCGPCAAQNPGFNTLLDANSTKIISIKYQTDWPGVDPMNAQNPAQVQTRVTYYSVSGVPDASMDGNPTNAPSTITQASINSEYAVASPFIISLTHHMSLDYDSIYIDVTVTATAAVSGTLKLHNVIIEKAIHFATAPGSNGEKDFYNVMRKMLPSDQGEALQSSFTAGQSQTFHYGVPIPSYIYDMNQVGVVSFIQDNVNKDVHQAAYSAPIPLALDGSITSITGIPVLQCTPTITPTCSFKNNGATTLTTATINYKVDNNTVSTYTWTGSLALNAIATITLPSVTATEGAHTFTVTVETINGSSDVNSGNNSQIKPFNIAITPTLAPITEPFTTVSYPPTGWVINNPDLGPTWIRKAGVGSTGGTTACSKMDFYNSPSGNIDELIIKPLDFSSFSPAYLTFYVAYAQYSTENDRLQVKVSTDCGTTWSSIFNKAGTTLSTAPACTTAFTPTSAQWRKETIDLNSLVGQGSVFISFNATSAYGNNLYVDEINITNVTGVDKQKTNMNQELNIFPNPTDGKITILNAENSEIAVYNIFGQNVITINHATALNTIDLSGLDQGAYFVKVSNGNSMVTKKIVLTK